MLGLSPAPQELAPTGSTRFDGLRRQLRSPRIAELCWWYLVLLSATIIAKLACLSTVYRHSDGFALDEMSLQSGGVSRSLLLLMVFARDMLQTAAIAGVMFFLTAPLPPMRRTSAYRAVALLLLLVIVGNYVSFIQLGSFASPELLDTAWGWVRLHPESLRAYLTPGAGALVALCVASIFAPGLLLQLARRQRPLAQVQHALPALVVVLLIMSAFLATHASARFGQRAFPMHGYWANVLQAATFGEQTPLAKQIPSQEELLDQYRKLAFYPAPGPDAELIALDLEPRIRPRHVIVVGLETAARAFYPLTHASDLPTFQRMSKQAIISDRHYTTSPYTRIANFSMLSGLYAPPSGLPVRFGPIATDGLGSVLRSRGYETSYVDSWVLDWLPDSGERAQAQMLGFDHVLDNPVRRDDGVYEILVQGEELAFDRAFTQIARAHDAGHKAAVFIGTMLGHAPWPAPKAKQHLRGTERLHEIARVFDRLFEHLLERLAQRGLSDDVLILVVGDHGLRYADEFESLGLHYSHSDLSFNVPFLLYAPGLLEHRLQVPYPTSHIDITPTLLHLVGVSTAGMLHHGGYMLDRRLANRVLYLTNSRLGPLDGLQWRDEHLTYHALSGVVELGDGEHPASMQPLTEHRARVLPSGLRDPAMLLERFAEHTNLIAGLLLQRAARHGGVSAISLCATSGSTGRNSSNCDN